MPEIVPKMNCPECGVEMNHHAQKPVDPTSAEDARQMDPALGALIEGVFTCPECGSTQCRRLQA